MNSYEATLRRSAKKVEQKAGLGVAVVGGLFGLLIFAISVMFLWPGQPDGGRARIVDGGRLADLTIGQPEQLVVPELPLIYLVRLDEKNVIALIAKDTFRGCTTPWRPNFSFEGKTGWFIDPCSSYARYDIEGNCGRGFCPRGLDQYPVEIRGNYIRINANPARIIRGKAVDFYFVPPPPPLP